MNKLAYNPSLHGSPAFTYFLRAWASVIDAGHALPGTPWSKDTQVIYATEDTDSKIIGCIAFNVHAGSETLWILLGHVAPEFRKQGLYQRMHTYLESMAPRLGCRHISSNISVNNDAGKAMAEALGKIPEFARFTKTLKVKPS